MPAGFGGRRRRSNPGPTTSRCQTTQAQGRGHFQHPRTGHQPWLTALLVLRAESSRSFSFGGRIWSNLEICACGGSVQSVIPPHCDCPLPVRGTVCSVAGSRIVPGRPRHSSKTTAPACPLRWGRFFGIRQSPVKSTDLPALIASAATWLTLLVWMHPPARRDLLHRGKLVQALTVRNDCDKLLLSVGSPSRVGGLHGPAAPYAPISRRGAVL
jgi:hypothetical protein